MAVVLHGLLFVVSENRYKFGQQFFYVELLLVYEPVYLSLRQLKIQLAENDPVENLPVFLLLR